MFEFLNINKIEFENVFIKVILIIISGIWDMKYYINNLFFLDFDEYLKKNCNVRYIRVRIEDFYMLIKIGFLMSDLMNV